jgi:hypothetical protein
LVNRARFRHAFPIHQWRSSCSSCSRDQGYRHAEKVSSPVIGRFRIVVDAASARYERARCNLFAWDLHLPRDHSHGADHHVRKTSGAFMWFLGAGGVLLRRRPTSISTRHLRSKGECVVMNGPAIVGHLGMCTPKPSFRAVIVSDIGENCSLRNDDDDLPAGGIRYEWSRIGSFVCWASSLQLRLMGSLPTNPSAPPCPPMRCHFTFITPGCTVPTLGRSTPVLDAAPVSAAQHGHGSSIGPCGWGAVAAFWQRLSRIIITHAIVKRQKE